MLGKETARRQAAAQKPARAYLLLALVGLVSAVAIGCSAMRLQLSEMVQWGQGEEGEAKKAWSGLSFAGQTVVEETPSASAAAAGFDSERAWSGYDDWEPAIAADPDLPYVYQLTTRYGGPKACRTCADPAIIFRRSNDGGGTWAPDQFLDVARRAQNDPQIEVAGDGTIYVAWLHGYIPGVEFMKSSDRGETWSSPIVIIRAGQRPKWSDKPILAISADGKDVYIAFNAGSSYVAASHDSGRSFSAPVKTSLDRRYWFHTGGAVAANGVVYFAAADYSRDYTGDVHINVLYSADGGGHWTTTRVDTSAELPACEWANGCYLGFLGPSAALAVDSAGMIMVAYNAGGSAGGPQKLYVRTSTDGLAWSDRQEVSNGDATVNNAFPALAAGPAAADFRLAWQDDRNGSTDAWNTWYRRTTDGGATWSPAARLSDLGSGAPYKNANGYSFPYGDYLEIAVNQDGTSYVIWGEGDSYSGPGGCWYTRGE